MYFKIFQISIFAGLKLERKLWQEWSYYQILRLLGPKKIPTGILIFLNRAVKSLARRRYQFLVPLEVAEKLAAFHGHYGPMQNNDIWAGKSGSLTAPVNRLQSDGGSTYFSANLHPEAMPGKYNPLSGSLMSAAAARKLFIKRGTLIYVKMKTNVGYILHIQPGLTQQECPVHKVHYIGCRFVY